MPVEGMRLLGPVQSSIPPSLFLCPGWFGGFFPCGHGPMLVCSPRSRAEGQGSTQAACAKSGSLQRLREVREVTQALLGKWVTAHRCHVRVGPVPGQHDPWPGTGHLSRVSVSTQPPYPAPLSPDTFNPPGRGMQPHSTGRTGGPGCTW